MQPVAEVGKVVALSRAFAHDSRLLGDWHDPNDDDFGRDQKRLEHAAKRIDLTRLHELLEHFEPRPETFFSICQSGHEAGARALLAKVSFHGVERP